MRLKGINMNADEVIANFRFEFKNRCNCYVENDECFDTKVALIYSCNVNDIVGTIEFDLFEDRYELNDSFIDMVTEAANTFNNVIGEVFGTVSFINNEWKFKLNI